MSTYELLDAHFKRMDTDPGYVAIWRKATALPNMRLITAMLAWAEQADGLRAMAQDAGQANATAELFALLDRGLKYGIVGCDCYSATACVEADEIRKLIREARA